ncbi:glycosyltransferase [Isoptericola sp. F-RaC21]|uniref:glycosyltransferase n=1 Tax=Isoptericola sp. F-RaC21 TaxID=3141452 RepID=UPI00315BE9BE
MQFVGITRFNLVTSTTLRHFNATAHLTLEEAKRVVFDPGRLGAKLATFETFCLPTYRVLAERDDRSHGLVLVSHDLPQPYRGRLAELCAGVPRLRVVELQDDDTIGGRVDPVLADVAAGGRLFSYRYDDDDVLSVDFLQRVEQICETVPDGTVVSMNKGFVVARLGDDSFGAHEQEDPLNAYGLGVVTGGARVRNVFDLGRHDAPSGPVFHEVETPAWIAFRHGLNDSQVNGTELGRLKKLLDHRRAGDRTAELLHEHFPHVGLAALEGLPVLPVHEILDAVARRALRRHRAVEAALARERKQDRALRQQLARTQEALARTRGELRDVRGSRSFRFGRAVAETRSLGAVVSLPRRLWLATRPRPTTGGSAEPRRAPTSGTARGIGSSPSTVTPPQGSR